MVILRHTALFAIATTLGCSSAAGDGPASSDDASTHDGAALDAVDPPDAAQHDAHDALVTDDGVLPSDTSSDTAHDTIDGPPDVARDTSDPIDSGKADSHAPDVAVDVGVDVGDASVTRDPLKWPFAANSIWNTPIGSGAVYVAAGLSSKLSAMPQIDDERIILTPTAPSTAINYSDAAWKAGADRCLATGGFLISVPMPTSYVIPDSGANNSAAILMADGHTIVQTQPLTRCTAGGSATSLTKPLLLDITGDGRLGAHGGSGLSAIGGSIRVGELRPGMIGMHHALKVNVYAAQALYRCTTYADCFRWPAANPDGYALGHYGSVGPNLNTAIKMGALLAIPASTDLTKLGLETEPGKQMAWTLQNYGAYIVDDTWGPSFALNAENGPAGSLRAQFKADWSLDFEISSAGSTAWSRDIQRLIVALWVVNNNSPTSIGGGGTPRQPLAPPFK